MVELVETVVRTLHVLFGVAWAGGLLLFSFGVMAPLQKAPPPVRGGAMSALMPRLIVFFGVTGFLAVVFGVWNQYLIAGEIDFRASRWNTTLGLALVLALVTLLTGPLIGRPAAMRLAKIGSPPPGAPPGPPPPEVVRLTRRLRTIAALNTLLALTIVVLMAYATQVRLG
ncbi:MAG: hypothetical protein ACT4PT_13335 [Methanobacteriota archaeon]